MMSKRFRSCWCYAVLALVVLELSSWQARYSVSSIVAWPLVAAVPVTVANHSITIAGAVATKTDEDDDDDTTLPIPSIQRRSLASEPPSTSTFGAVLRKALIKGLGGGIPGAIAGVIQVITLMWLRTIINHQARYGTSFAQAVKLLYKDGGIPRFYSGLTFALFQAPLTRFVATASNDGVLALLANLPATRHWGPGVTTIFASTFVGFFRILLMPIDTCKTVLQVDSQEGFRNLMKRVREGKILVLYAGSIATAVSAIVGHYPWFVCYNFLKQAGWLALLIPSAFLRNAAIGLMSSIASDAVVNVFRVVKTAKQTMGTRHDVSYVSIVRMIVASDGWMGLFGRGLRTRIFANALQSILFTVIWRGLAEHWGNASNDGGNGTKAGIRGAQTIVAQSTHEDPEELIDIPDVLLENRHLNPLAR
ncbi:mitochondrial carrier protein [Nitzschia inconspicua]|uniref:Mitochondrial carrier protein n=1 Tax=Nitzschia inconspicua TaxID=303405 RepID=A0A9K3PX53_9STRA|nr:mitochondrial carrier protein [Nitzschia inconspicua]